MTEKAEKKSWAKQHLFVPLLKWSDQLSNEERGPRQELTVAVMGSSRGVLLISLLDSLNCLNGLGQRKPQVSWMSLCHWWGDWVQERYTINSVTKPQSRMAELEHDTWGRSLGNDERKTLRHCLGHSGIVLVEVEALNSRVKVRALKAQDTLEPFIAIIYIWCFSVPKNQNLTKNSCNTFFFYFSDGKSKYSRY